MREYPKIQSVYKRDPTGKKFLVGEYSLPEFEYLADNDWIWREKVDGTNIRVMIGDGAVVFGGKTDDAQIPAFLLQALEAQFDPLAAALNTQFPDGACLYGEGYGARIQKGGGNYRPDNGFTLFDIRVGEWWLQRDDVERVASEFGIEPVPIIGRGDLHDLEDMVRAGFHSRWGDFIAEGVVATPEVEMRTRSGHRIITKLKHRDFALAQEAA